LRKVNGNDVSVRNWASGLFGNLVTVDDQLLTLLDQLIAMRLLESCEDREPSRRHYTLGKRMKDLASRIATPPNRRSITD
jgi:hypothetical protein